MTNVRITAPPRMTVDLTGDTPTPRARLPIPTMKPIDDLCSSCLSAHVVTFGRHSSEGPTRHCRNCGHEGRA